MKGFLDFLGRIGKEILKWTGSYKTLGRSAVARTFLERGAKMNVARWNRLLQTASNLRFIKGVGRPIITGKGLLYAYAPHLIGGGALGAGAYLGYRMLKSSELNKRAFFEYLPILLGLGLGARTLLKAWRGHAGWAKAFSKVLKKGKLSQEVAEVIGHGSKALEAQKAAKKLLKARKPADIKIPGDLANYLKPFEKAVKAAPEKFPQALTGAYSEVLKETNKLIRRAKQQVPLKYKPNIYQRLGGIKGFGLAALPIGAGAAVYALMRRKEPQYISSPYYGMIPYGY